MKIGFALGRRNKFKYKQKKKKANLASKHSLESPQLLSSRRFTIAANFPVREKFFRETFSWLRNEELSENFRMFISKESKLTALLLNLITQSA